MLHLIYNLVTFRSYGTSLIFGGNHGQP